VDESLSAWFAREILPHEAALVRYLTRICPNRDEVFDLRQDVYVKVFEAARIHRPDFARPFLFTTARHLVVDRIRRNRIVSIEPAGDSDVLNVVIDEISPERRLNARQELKQLGVAFGLLPPKCREVVWLRKVDEIPQAQVAKLLGISVRTVEFHVRKGVRLLAHALLGEGADCRVNDFEDLYREEQNGKESDGQ
jgi:RNA polymerase sigma-70 factor (ECF subfamily)